MSSDQPRRTNSYTARASTDAYRQCLFEWLACHAPLWNQINYRRRQAYFHDEDVWSVSYTDLYEDYAPLLGKASCQQIARKNGEAWRSFFEQLDQYNDDSDPRVTNRPSPPGYWGNRDDGYKMHGLVRNDLYDIEWRGTTSTLEFGVGQALKEKHGLGYHERITLELNGEQQWYGSDCRLELIHDEAADALRVRHPVELQSDTVKAQRLDDLNHTLHQENAAASAAIDLGANNALTIVTTSGETIAYHARPLFEQFRQTTIEIADRQARLPDETDTSRRIQRLYDERSRQRDHAWNAAIKHAANWLLEHNVSKVYVGDLSDVLETHWKPVVNEKTHSFWSHGALAERLGLTLGDVGIEVEEVPEVDTSSTCPECQSQNVTRDGDEFHCHDGGLEAHSDVVGAWNMLQAKEGSMARPAALSAGRDRDATGAYCEWDGHNWTPAGEQRDQQTKAVSANPQALVR